jgi:hypothetical protein
MVADCAALLLTHTDNTTPSVLKSSATSSWRRSPPTVPSAPPERSMIHC